MSTCSSVPVQLSKLESQMQLDPKTQHTLPSPLHDVVPVESTDSEQDPPYDWGVHENGWQLHDVAVACGQP